MKGFVNIKELSEINGGSSLVSKKIDSSTIITIKYGVLVPTEPIAIMYGVKPLYGIPPITSLK
ncbi:hypothetical protein [Clostridium cellulovorans]|uniref:Uncharacterized protein n=1 Tax=Clostridium cellulovorans (strain ATCC 35296 / DSM 3052 / OCM 3 / 743B) TaxID=573061 RepID=D9SMC5_CLOC7|nr:hypothetical protein [Clostridium cellulovorans]ADL53781.1 hypothetical protein Clocel_4120 [Clostridium cellulovorans 743B]